MFILKFAEEFLLLRILQESNKKCEDLLSKIVFVLG